MGLKVMYALGALVLSALAPVRAQETINVGNTGAGSPLQWPSHIAIAKGFYREAGVDVQLIPMPSSAAGMQQLAAGSLNISSSGLVDAIRAIDKGAPVRLLRIEIATSPYEIYARPGIKSFAELKGKVVMIGGAKDITRIYFEELAGANGLKAGENDYVYVGATAARYAALASGSIDATILFPPFNFQAAAAGYTRLAGSADVASEFPFSGYSMNVAFARAKPGAVAGFMNAYARGVAFFYDERNAAEAQRVFVEVSKSSPKDAADAYAFFRKLKPWTPRGEITRERVQMVIDYLKKNGEIDGAAELTRFYDAALAPK